MMGQVYDGEAGEDHEPEPEEHIDLLIDNVYWENTLDVMSLKSIYNIHLAKHSSGGKIKLNFI